MLSKQKNDTPKFKPVTVEPTPYAPRPNSKLISLNAELVAAQLSLDFWTVFRKRAHGDRMVIARQLLVEHLKRQIAELESKSKKE